MPVTFVTESSRIRYQPVSRPNLANLVPVHKFTAPTTTKNFSINKSL